MVLQGGIQSAGKFHSSFDNVQHVNFARRWMQAWNKDIGRSINVLECVAGHEGTNAGLHRIKSWSKFGLSLQKEQENKNGGLFVCLFVAKEQ
jgi:hypothetical protein